ncbi:Os10g0545400 [Oryza sativa Japonica Group]|uniref:Os10g0545400 protein n=1 Tax=Oryza sativa subsp. japonica TaxID=39947 RepID=Q0IVZ3_ORYSJ|nr:Os10g0545400 [Oryza sativa Japonica Group]|eukprot:NP_001065208.2 Os10g0545400 [Oryza sativa Japonica Group]
MALVGCSNGEAAAPAATWTPPYCTVVAADMSDFCYLSCPRCERALPDHADACAACTGRGGGGGPVPARVYRLRASVATHDRVVPVVLFDRAARVLVGCPADELARFFAAHAGAARAAEEALEGEVCRVAMRAFAKGAAERFRAVSVVPLRDGFRPLIDTLRELYCTADPTPATSPPPRLETTVCFYLYVMVKRKKVVTDLSRRKIRTESIDLAQLVEATMDFSKWTITLDFDVTEERLRNEFSSNSEVPAIALIADFTCFHLHKFKASRISVGCRINLPILNSQLNTSCVRGCLELRAAQRCKRHEADQSHSDAPRTLCTVQHPLINRSIQHRRLCGALNLMIDPPVLLVTMKTMCQRETMQNCISMLDQFSSAFKNGGNILFSLYASSVQFHPNLPVFVST